MDDKGFVILSGNPVLSVLAMTLEGTEFEVVRYDREREIRDKETDGERRE